MRIERDHTSKGLSPGPGHSEYLTWENSHRRDYLIMNLLNEQLPANWKATETWFGVAHYRLYIARRKKAEFHRKDFCLSGKRGQRQK